MFLALLVFCADGCGPPDERWSLPRLYMDPPSAMQGAVVPVNITAPSLSFEECSNFDPSALRFTHEGSSDYVTVATLQALASGALRAELIIAPTAQVGSYDVLYECNPQTLLTGTFEVRERNEEPTLDFSVNVANAGSADLEIDITSDDTTFIEGVSHTIFGDGESVLVKEEMLITNSHELRVTIDISVLAPVGEMEVAVTTGSVVARGTFYILEKKYPTIQVEDDEVVRPRGGENNVQASLVVSGRSTWFSESSGMEDAGPDEIQTEVSFPLNPGITVDMVDVISPFELNMNIQVDDHASLGPTPLVVTTEDEIAITDFTVLSHSDEPVVEIKPNIAVRGAEDLLLLVETTDLPMDGSTTIQFAQPGCSVDSFDVLTANEAVAFISIGDSFLGETGVLEIETGLTNASAYLRVVDADDFEANVEIGGSAEVDQGAVYDSVLLEIRGGLFTDDDIVEIDSRTGIKLVSFSATGDGGSLVMRVDVAPDAPCGPAAVNVFAESAWHQVFLEVVSQGLNPYLSFEPSVLLPGRRTADVEIEVQNHTLDGGVLSLEVDDPAIHVDQVEFTNATSADSTLTVAPSSSYGTSVLYLQNGEDRIAGALRQMGRINPQATAVDPTISRDDGESFEKILINLTGLDFKYLVASVFDGIGVEVERVSWIAGTQVELEFKLASEGPGGWFGVLLSDGMQRIALPVYLEGDDESLTAVVSPNEFEGWDRQMDVTMAIPAEANLDPVLSFAHAAMSDVFASLGDTSAPSSVPVAVEIPYSFIEEEVPIVVTAQKGAAIGLLQVVPIDVVSLIESESWSDTLALGEAGIAYLAELEYPALLRASFGRYEYADLDAYLLSEGDLVFEGGTTNGFLLAFSSMNGKVVFTPASEPSGLPQSLEVHSMGASMTSLSEDNDEPLQALIIADDPCTTPFLGIGEIGGAMDIDRVELPETTCRLVADVLSRRLGERAWALPDIAVELRASDDSILDQVTAWPDAGDMDARLYFDLASESRQVLLSAEQGTEGTYFLNVRRPSGLREVCRGAGQSFIELSMEPGTLMDTTVLELLDPDTGDVLASFSLFGTAPSDGVVVIGDVLEPWVDLDDTVGVTIIAENDSFALTLAVDGEIVDAVQVGGTGDFGEGDPSINDPFECFFRFAGVDTNDNLSDFVGSWEGTPGS